METRYDERPRDWKNLFPKMRFCYTGILFHTFCYYWGKEYWQDKLNTLLTRGSLIQSSILVLLHQNLDDIHGFGMNLTAVKNKKCGHGEEFEGFSLLEHAYSEYISAYLKSV